MSLFQIAWQVECMFIYPAYRWKIQDNQTAVCVTTFNYNFCDQHTQFCHKQLFILKKFKNLLCYTQGYFCDRMRWNAVPEALSQKNVSQNGILELFFPPAIDIMRLGMSCYPTAFLSNKLTKRPLKFQQVTANNSLDFVQFLKKNPPPRPNFGSLYAFRDQFFFFRKIALVIRIKLY
jgi:hypothetical protein